MVSRSRTHMLHDAEHFSTFCVKFVIFRRISLKFNFQGLIKASQYHSIRINISSNFQYEYTFRLKYIPLKIEWQPIVIQNIFIF